MTSHSTTIHMYMLYKTVMKLETSKHHNVDEAIMCPVCRGCWIEEKKKLFPFYMSEQ